MNSRPRCLHTTLSPVRRLTSTWDRWASASSTFQAGYSSSCRRESAMLPQALPLNSTNQTFPPRSRRNSIINKPRHPVSRIKRSAVDLRSSETGCETQALEPEPWGFIIRSLRWALHARTPSLVASPNKPSPVPRIRGWTRRGFLPAHSETAASISSEFPQIQNLPL